jgi:hypothetical protein
MNARKRKNPLVAGLLALLFGPLGLLYLSWKAMIAGTLLVFLGTEIVRFRSGTDTVPPWWPFVVAPSCAVYAYLTSRAQSTSLLEGEAKRRRWITLRDVGLSLYVATIYNVVVGFVRLASGGDWGARFLTAALAFIVGFLLWWKSPEQTWDLPAEVVAELKTRLGPQFALLRTLYREGVLPQQLFREFSVPALVFHLNLLGPQLAMAKRMQDAEEAFRVALRLDPDNVSAKAGLSALLSDTGRLEEARQYAKEGLSDLKPGLEDLRPMLEDIVAAGSLRSSEVSEIQEGRCRTPL